MNNPVRLTNNEKVVLKNLINKGRITDTEISKSMPVSQQAVYQMRKRLEDAGIVLGYMPIIDFTKIGINNLHIMGIEVLPGVWENLKEHELNKRLCEIPFLFMAFRVPSAQISYILIFGFVDLHEQESFTKSFESILANKLNVKWSYTTAIENLLAYDSLNLVFHTLDGFKKDYRAALKDLCR